LVADVFARATEKRLCSIFALEKGFLPVAELLDDIAIDAPRDFQIMATVTKGAGLDKDEGRRARIAQKSMERDTFFELLADDIPLLYRVFYLLYFMLLPLYDCTTRFGDVCFQKQEMKG